MKPQDLVGMPYRADFDCADFVQYVQMKLFGRRAVLSSERPRGPGAEIALAAESVAYCRPTEQPQHGDLILFFDARQPGPAPTHAGVLILQGHRRFALHSAASYGGSVLTEFRYLSGLGLTIERYYSWVT